MSSDGNTARRQATRKNTGVDRRGRVRAYRDYVERVGQPPLDVKWLLSNPHITRKRFTDFQWAILQARWPYDDHVWWPRNSSVNVGRTLGMSGKSARVRKAEAAAMRMVHELWDWQYANRKWHALQSGQPVRHRRPGDPKHLTEEDRRLLARHRKARPKLGRREQPELTEIYVGARDAYDRRTSRQYPGPLRNADMSDRQRADIFQEDSAPDTVEEVSKSGVVEGKLPAADEDEGPFGEDPAAEESTSTTSVGGDEDKDE